MVRPADLHIDEAKVLALHEEGREGTKWSGNFLTKMAASSEMDEEIPPPFPHSHALAEVRLRLCTVLVAVFFIAVSYFSD